MTQQLFKPENLPTQKSGQKKYLTPHWVLALALLSSLSGCASFSGVNPFAQLKLPAALASTESSEASFALLQNASTTAPVVKPSSVQLQNWLGFEDAQLNQLIDLALKQNPNMAIAQARIRKAQSALGILGQSQNINATGSFDATRQLFSENAIYPPPIAGSVLTTSTLQAAFSWELDFFGKQKALLNAGDAQVQVTQAELKAAQLGLSAQVAKSYLALVKIELLQQNYLASTELIKQQENLLSQRIKAGIDNQAELFKTQASKAELQYKLAVLQEQKQALRHVLAALTAQPESSLVIQINTNTFVEQAKKINSQASQLYLDELANRPDIQVAKWRVEASNSDIKATKAQFYPNINLVGFLGLSSIGLSQLFDSGSSQVGVGPAVRLPLFDGGRLRAYLGGKTADFDIALESYNSVLLEAVKEASEPISTAQAIVQQQNAQQQLLSHLQQAYELANQRYQSGLNNSLIVLSSQGQLQEAKRAQIELQIKVLDNQIQLVKAFGGVRPSS